MSNGSKVALLALACFATSISEFAIVGMIDVVAASAGVSVAMAGQLLTAFALSGGIGVPLAVMALAKLERRDVMTIALAMVVLGCVLMSAVTDFYLMMLSRVFMAIGSGIFAVTCFATAPQLAAPGRKASAVATVTLGFNAALVLGLPFSRLMAATLPWTAVFWFVGVASAFMIPVVRAIVPHGKGSAPKPLHEQLSYLRHPRVLLTFGLNLFWVAGYATLYSYITPYLQEATALGAAALSAVLLAFGASTLIGNKLGGWLCDRFGVRPVVLAALAGQAVLLVALFMLDGPAWLVMTAVLAWGVFSWVPSPIINLAVVQAAPEAADVMLSLNNSATQFAYAIGAGVGGIVVASAGAHPLCLVSIVLLILAAASGAFATKPEGKTNALAQGA
ncbi:MFS transporter [Slackia exigua]|uniref:MFS transporter n=1 Tax=Slackia exigua TaxID=84109 RepID=UPI0028DC64F0|nr:MFS transporter [Slackia exigua]